MIGHCGPQEPMMQTADDDRLRDVPADPAASSSSSSFNCTAENTNYDRLSCPCLQRSYCHRSKWRLIENLSRPHHRSSQCYSRATSSHHNVSRSHYSISVSPYLYPFLVLVLLLIVAPCADGCSSRSTPKPRPPSHSAMRPNITFQTYACPPAYAAWYCLNGATCFTVKIAESILYNCECADGYMGQRCEFKDLDGTYLPTRERLFMGMGSVVKSSQVNQVFLAVLIFIVVVAIVLFIITQIRTKAKRARIIKQQRSDTISYIDCTVTPSSSVLPMPMTSSGDMSYADTRGQSISYITLSQQRYPYLAEYQGAIHRHDTTNDHSMMVSSRIPAKNHRSSTTMS